MGKLEARAIIENTGNYEEDEMEWLMNIYDTLAKHVGWQDKRRDKRFVVKFHDIFYYLPEEYDNERIDALFEEFCNEQYEMLEDDAIERGVEIEALLTPYNVGHYQAFQVDIPEIAEDNIVDLTMKLYDEYSWQGGERAEDQIYVMETLKIMEDNYMEYWFDFLEQVEFDEKVLKEMKEKYNKDKKGEK